MRRMYGGYFKGFHNASKLRARLMKANSIEEVLLVLDESKEEADNVIQAEERRSAIQTIR